MNIPNRHFLPGGLIILLLISVASPGGFADLTVIYDSGRTRAIEPLLSPFVMDKKRSDRKNGKDESASRKSMSRTMPGSGTVSHLLPVRSPGLQVGDPTATELRPEVLSRLAQGNPRPFFLIGSDPVSLQWLAAHRDRLKSLGAVGMLVQADTEQAVRQVADISNGLPITLGSASDLARALGIHHYPVLITRDGISQ